MTKSLSFVVALGFFVLLSFAAGSAQAGTVSVARESANASIQLKSLDEKGTEFAPLPQADDKIQAAPAIDESLLAGRRNRRCRRSRC